jgi:hypothetical protein
MKLSLTEIPHKNLDEFIKLMDGYCGIFSEDRSWIWDENSHPYKITLYCYLVSTGELFILNGKLTSANDEHNELIQFIEGFFAGKCIVNFTDLLFLDEINSAFCGGKWHNVHQSWLVKRPEFLDILALRKPKFFQEIQAYEIEAENFESEFGDMYFIQLAKGRTTLIDYLECEIQWRRESISMDQFKNKFNIGEKGFTIRQIPLEEFRLRITETVERQVGSLLN